CDKRKHQRRDRDRQPVAAGEQTDADGGSEAGDGPDDEARAQVGAGEANNEQGDERVPVNHGLSSIRLLCSGATKRATAAVKVAFSSPAIMCVARLTRTCSACGTQRRNSAMVSSETTSLRSPLISNVGTRMRRAASSRRACSRSL